ncbi:MAG: SDR family NAD(P)-dependent oxidoreductase [Rhodospirillales bacterium]|nr:SDR family NAD(P)-dependent oxidoreductase [Rhodospirillales bacterium]MCB9997067.1 SDR family NAD(P)-dependent oxidoreductase [Rhodospirillales bacterium]
MSADLPRNILITGASSGIGAALARAYAAPGVRLFLTGRNAQRLSSVAADCRAAGAEAEDIIVDVTDRAAMAAMVIDVDTRFPLDLVIANAGVSGGMGGPDGESGSQVRRIFDINLTGVLNTAEPILPRMKARGCGQVALMSSLASFSGWPGAPAYSASKGAVRFYGEALRGAYARDGVKINVICPGFIRTPLTAVNDYPMPFMMDDTRCAAIIVKALHKNRGRIAFPLPMYLMAGFFGILPHWLSLKFFTKLPAKPATDVKE